MDPLTIMAAVTTAYNGVKKAVEVGQEVSNIYHELGKWADLAGDLKSCIQNAEYEEEHPSIWKKISFDKSETAEAFDLYAAKVKLKEMEDEIFHMFAYGDLCHLGVDGYREFKKMRQEVHERREKILKNQYEAKKAFIKRIATIGVIVLACVISASIIWGAIELILAYA